MTATASSHFVLRNAAPEDSGLILNFIRDLAAYEKLSHEVVAREEDIARSLFGPSPKAFCVLAEADGAPAGFALCFYNYSTFQGRAGIYIEDLYVKPEFRGRGLGKMFFQHLAQRAVAEGCGRIQWWVLNWNAPSIAFYKSLQAVAMDEWTVYRLERQAIEELAKRAT